jgi:hypothetical protein
MKTGHTHLFIPGPTNVPDEVRRAMNVGHGGHARAGFRRSDAGPVFRPQARACAPATGEVFIFPGSGTRRWEAAITNTLNPGDKVLMARFGQFSTLWVEMAERLGLDVEVIDVAWGAGVPVAEFERHPRRRHQGRDQGGLRHPQRDRHRRHLRRRRRAPRARRVFPRRAAVRGRASAPSRRSTSAWMTGASTSPSPAARRA